MAMLPFVPDRAGLGFFKLCSASAATMTTAGLWLLVRRFGLDGRTGAPAGEAIPWCLAACAAFLAATIVYNRAWHLGWCGSAGRLLALSVVTGVAAVLLGTPPARACARGRDGPDLGPAASGGRVRDDPRALPPGDPGPAHLRAAPSHRAPHRGTRAAHGRVGVALAAGDAGAYQDLKRGGRRPVESGRRVRVDADPLRLWPVPLSLIWFIWKTVEIRSTQSATGITLRPASSSSSQRRAAGEVPARWPPASRSEAKRYWTTIEPTIPGWIAQ